MMFRCALLGVFFGISADFLLYMRGHCVRLRAFGGLSSSVFFIEI
jgi:hypothetical protein